jgi:hypothetical protein
MMFEIPKNSFDQKGSGEDESSKEKGCLHKVRFDEAESCDRQKCSQTVSVDAHKLN